MVLRREEQGRPGAPNMSAVEPRAPAGAKYSVQLARRVGRADDYPVKMHSKVSVPRRLWLQWSFG